MKKPNKKILSDAGKTLAHATPRKIQKPVAGRVLSEGRGTKKK